MNDLALRTQYTSVTVAQSNYVVAPTLAWHLLIVADRVCGE